jgi:hypothetical protein
MLPSQEQLREQSRMYREIAESSTDPAEKTELTTYALALAQIAEAIGREAGAEADCFERLLERALPKEKQQVVQTLTKLFSAPQTTGNDERYRDIDQWRMRADELRATADQFVIQSAKDSLNAAATNYDKMADRAEARLAGCAEAKKRPPAAD